MTRMMRATLHWDGFLVWAVNEENIAIMFIDMVYKQSVKIVPRGVLGCMNFDESRPSSVRLTWISQSRIGHIFGTLTI